MVSVVLALLMLTVSPAGLAPDEEQPGPRARTFGLVFGTLPIGPMNAITDVAGVRVGSVTLREGTRLNTGITAIVPHDGNLYLEKVPAAAVVFNGYGKLAGSTQVEELGELETPVLLTGTLNVPRVADGLMDYMLGLPGMESVYSINPVVGETNDGYLSDIRSRPLGAEHVVAALNGTEIEPLNYIGSRGAGAGTRCFGWKGGIGTSSRQLSEQSGGWTVGVLVQSNFGGVLTISGRVLGPQLAGLQPAQADHDGSIMIIIATDAPLSHRNLQRLARRAFLGVARTGGYAGNGSGDYAIAFSTHPELRIMPDDRPVEKRPQLSNRAMSPLFLAVVEATEEAIIDSLFTARTTEGHLGTAEALPVQEVLEALGVEPEPAFRDP